MEPFNAAKMVRIVKAELQKEIGGMFDDKTLNYMITSDLEMRRAKIDLEENGDYDPAFENDYFQNAAVRLPLAFKDEAIIKILKRFGYIL